MRKKKQNASPSSSQDNAIDYKNAWKKKRKMNAYLFWAGMMRQKFFRENRDKTFREVSRIMSKTWHSMPDSTKAKWLKKSRRRNQIHAFAESEDLN